MIKNEYKENKIAKMVCRIFESCPPVKVIRDGVTRTVVANGWGSPECFRLFEEFKKHECRECDASKILEREWYECCDRYLPWQWRHCVDLKLEECERLPANAGLLTAYRYVDQRTRYGMKSMRAFVCWPAGSPPPSDDLSAVRLLCPWTFSLADVDASGL